MILEPHSLKSFTPNLKIPKSWPRKAAGPTGLPQVLATDFDDLGGFRGYGILGLGFLVIMSCDEDSLGGGGGARSL